MAVCTRAAIGSVVGLGAASCFSSLGVSPLGGVIHGVSSALGFEVGYLVMRTPIHNESLLKKIVRVAMSFFGGIFAGMVAMSLTGSPITFEVSLKLTGALLAVAVTLYMFLCDFDRLRPWDL